VLAGLLDPAASEDWQAAKEVSDFAAGDDDVLLLTSYEGLGSLELGALERLARVVLELSLREGFDLAPCEALWKRTPVVGGADGALGLTVRDGVDGFLARDPEELAARLVELVRDPGLAIEMGRSGRERVRERFLVTAALERELRALADTVQ
jgi:trehalose synthase